MEEIRFGHRVKVIGGFWNGYSGIAVKYRNDQFLIELDVDGQIRDEYVPQDLVVLTEESNNNDRRI